MKVQLLINENNKLKKELEKVKKDYDDLTKIYNEERDKYFYQNANLYNKNIYLISENIRLQYYNKEIENERLIIEIEKQKQIINLLNNRLKESIKIERELSVERVLLAQINDIDKAINNVKQYDINNLVSNGINYINNTNIKVNNLPSTGSLTRTQLIKITKDIEEINTNIVETIKYTTSALISASYVLSAGVIIKIYNLLSNKKDISHIENIFNEISNRFKNINTLTSRYAILFNKFIHKMLNIEYTISSAKNYTSSNNCVLNLEYAAVNDININW